MFLKENMVKTNLKKGIIKTANVHLNAFCIQVSRYTLNPLPNKALFCTCLLYKSLENTEGKGEIARDEQFLLFPQCFLPFL